VFLEFYKKQKTGFSFFFLILYFGEMEINYRMKFLVSCVRNVVLELKKSYVVVVLVVRGKKKGVSDTGAKRARSIFSTFFCFFLVFCFCPPLFFLYTLECFLRWTKVPFGWTLWILVN
jgi:hypothetical protein